MVWNSSPQVAGLSLLVCDLGRVTELLSGSVFSSVRYRCSFQVSISTFCVPGMVLGEGGAEGHRHQGALPTGRLSHNPHCNEYRPPSFYHHRALLGSVGNSGHQG